MNYMKKIYLIATLLLCCLNSCIPPKKQSSEWKAKHVILIGIDAWGAYSMNKANIPNIRSLMADGSYNLKKRSVLPSSSHKFQIYLLVLQIQTKYSQPFSQYYERPFLMPKLVTFANGMALGI